MENNGHNVVAFDRDKAIEALTEGDDYDKLLEKIAKWWVHIKDYKRPTESLNQFSLRAGVGRDEAFNWKIRRSEVRILLGVPMSTLARLTIWLF